MPLRIRRPLRRLTDWRVSARPNLVALAQDGTVLTTLGPDDVLDSLTINSLAK